jgi:hypothetical protein
VSALNGKHLAQRPLLVELAGPAGVGKSTLAAALARRVGATPRTIWGLPVIPLIGNGIRLLPTLLSLWAHSRSPLWDEARHVVRLTTLHRAFRQGEPGRESVAVFDEGPVFALAWLRGFGHETLRDQASDAWWRATFREWGAVIDAVVVLDAPDSILAQRIRARPDEHEVKQASDTEITAWMARFRTALDWVLAELVRQDGPTVLRLEAAQAPPDRIAERVLEGLDWGAYAG